jgi:hypothetical protein
VKRLLALAVGLFGARALLKRYRVRGAVAEAPPPPVDELRAKLAETRATEEAQVEEASEPATSVEDRRADVHARARRTIDELQDGGQ